EVAHLLGEQPGFGHGGQAGGAERDTGTGAQPAAAGEARDLGHGVHERLHKSAFAYGMIIARTLYPTGAQGGLVASPGQPPRATPRSGPGQGFSAVADGGRSGPPDAAPGP